MLNQQQQAIYQQFQMVQELRRNGSAPLLYGPPMHPQPFGQIANYDEIVSAQKSAVLRGEYLYQQSDRLLTKYNEIEDMKKPLQLRIYDLSLNNNRAQIICSPAPKFPPRQAKGFQTGGQAGEKR